MICSSERVYRRAVRWFDRAAAFALGMVTAALVFGVTQV